MDVKFEVIKFCQIREEPCSQSDFCAQDNCRKYGSDIKKGEETMSNEIVSDAWIREEEQRLQDRKRKKKMFDNIIKDNMEQIREGVKEIPDEELPSLVQLYDASRRYDYKCMLVAERLAEEALRENLQEGEAK